MEMHLYRQLMAGRQEMLDALNGTGKQRRSWLQTACINIIFDGSTHLSNNQACHAGLSNIGKAGSFAVVNALMKPLAGKMLDEEEALYFLEWLLNESPYSSTFITKSAEEALFYKATISSSHHPANLMAAGMVASRSLWEFPEVARFFVDMGKAGVKKDLAFFLAYTLNCGFDRSGKANWERHNRGHQAMDPDGMDGEGLLNYLNHNVINPKPNYHKDYNYFGYDGMYDYGGLKVKDFIRDKFPFNGKVEQKVGFFPADAGAKDKQCKYEDLIQGMVEFQHVLLKEIGYEEKKHA